MANVLAPFGFRDYRRLDGAAATGAITTRTIALGNATAIFAGDPVTSLSTGYITRSTAGTTQIHGIFLGCEYISVSQGRRLYSNFWPGSDAAYDVTAKVISDPLMTFIVQANGGPVNMQYYEMNANFALGTGSTLTGLSGALLDTTTIATTSTLPFRIISAVSGVGNGTDITTAYNYVVVAPNNWDFKSLTGI